MKAVEKIAEEKNYTAINLGNLDELMEYSLIHKVNKQKIEGKVFLKDVTNATGIAIGTGKSNTDLIIAKKTSTGRPFAAASLAVAHNCGGYTDWFLPSKD